MAVALDILYAFFPFLSPRFVVAALTATVLASALRPVLAQAPVNDVISWPSGLLLLASVLYAALGTNCDALWQIDPTVGLFMGTGLPTFSFPIMQRVRWAAKACHFVSRIRTAHGKSNFWIRAEEVSQVARAEALQKALNVIHCVTYAPLTMALDKSLWSLTSAGLIRPRAIAAVTPDVKPAPATPSARDFLLFAAIEYHFFDDWEVNIYQQDELVFSTKGAPSGSVVDVDSEEDALLVVAAHMVARPHSQSPLRALAQQDETAPARHVLHMDSLDLDSSACAIDFHSYSPTKYKVAASLRELAGAYYRVVQYVKQSVEPTGQLAQIDVGQSMWIAILGGVLLDNGRLTIQNLPGRWGVMGVTADEAYLSRIESMLDAVAPYANTSEFSELVFSGGTSRRATYPFLFAGLCGQMIICYFLCVGTSAGVWTAVALSNSLYAGRLTDWHSLFNGKTLATEEPGMKMYVPRSPTREIMAIATFDRSTPRTGTLRPGLLLNFLGIVAGIFGAIFQNQTRAALDFGAPTSTPSWVVYTSIVLAMGTTFLLTLTVVLQQLRERNWFDDSEVGQRWMFYTTFFGSCTVCALAIFFMKCKEAKLWPVLDVVTFLSAIPLGVLENGRMISADDNMLHLALLNRWIMGAIASSVGSSAASGTGVCWK